MKTKGFTLTELIVVIIILGILSAVAIPRYMNMNNEINTQAVDNLWSQMLAVQKTTKSCLIAQGEYSPKSNPSNTDTQDAVLTICKQNSAPTWGGVITPSGYMIAISGFDISNAYTSATTDLNYHLNPNGIYTQVTDGGANDAAGTPLTQRYPRKAFFLIKKPQQVVDLYTANIPLCGIEVVALDNNDGAEIDYSTSTFLVPNPQSSDSTNYDSAPGRYYMVKWTNGC